MTRTKPPMETRPLMVTNPRAVPRAVLRLPRLLLCLLAGTWLLVCLLGSVLIVLGRAVGFVLEPLDQLVAARLGCPPVLPQLRRWRRDLAREWRAYRVGALDGEVMDGVWR